MMSDALPTLRLLSYNVRSLRDDAAAVARVVRAAEPHVVCIQEAPRLFRWRAKCAAFARHCGLVVVTGGGTAAGNLILSSLGVEVVAHRDVLLSRDRGLHQRGVALADLRWRDARFVVASTHLDLEPEPRLRHVTELDRALDQFNAANAATIVVGDVNDEPGSPTWSALSAARTDAYSAIGAGDGFTFTAANPRRRIDGIFVDPSITARSATVLDGPDAVTGSDHRPVLVGLQF